LLSSSPVSSLPEWGDIAGGVSRRSASLFGCLADRRSARPTDPVEVRRPAVVEAQRTYESLRAIVREINDARVWSGLHWRQSMRDGNQIDREVAAHVSGNFFRPTKRQ
jgi:hypothetical protein